MAAGAGFGLIRINLVAAEFDANAACGIACQCGVKFVAPVAVRDVEHEVAVIQLHGGEDVSAEIDFGVKHFRGELDAKPGMALIALAGILIARPVRGQSPIAARQCRRQRLT